MCTFSECETSPSIMLHTMWSWSCAHYCQCRLYCLTPQGNCALLCKRWKVWCNRQTQRCAIKNEVSYLYGMNISASLLSAPVVHTCVKCTGVTWSLIFGALPALAGYYMSVLLHSPGVWKVCPSAFHYRSLQPASIYSLWVSSSIVVHLHSMLLAIGPYMHNIYSDSLRYCWHALFSSCAGGVGLLLLTDIKCRRVWIICVWHWGVG